MQNYFEHCDWNWILHQDKETGAAGSRYTKDIITQYHSILCPKIPEFLHKYLELPLLTRLKGVGLLCGSDWTPLFCNRFMYTRFDHSLGVALIIWHFTGDKAQTVAGLLHDVSTPAFSHVADFMKGDALTQSATEEPNRLMILADKALAECLASDGLSAEAVADYHIYPVADNEIPRLSADRLEYMFPSGMVLEGSWSLDEIRFVYNDLTVAKNEDGADELCFSTVEAAELYCRRFCMTGHVLQLNEDKLCLELLAQTLLAAEKAGIIRAEDCMTMSEADIMQKFRSVAENTAVSNDTAPELKTFIRLYRTFSSMKSIKHTDKALPDHFCVNLAVKKRWINPLVLNPMDKDGKITAERLYNVSEKARHIINSFCIYEDTAWGCAEYTD